MMSSQNRAHVLLYLMAGMMYSEAGQYTLGMASESSCTKTHYYEADDVFTVSANGVVHDDHCPLTFIQSGTWPYEGSVEPCLSLCVRILSYTMESCQVKMAYHDGIKDFSPVTFDCHTFPPVMWCSSKNDLKVTVSQLKNYQGKNYAITLEVKPFCGTMPPTTDSSVLVHPQPKPSKMSQTALIIGAVVGTLSILFVLGWVMYCYRHRQRDDESEEPERRTRGPTPNTAQSYNRYAPVERNAPSSQSSSDRGLGRPMEKDGIHADIGDRRLYSPFQPPQPSNREMLLPQYSDSNRGPQGDQWYPMSNMGPAGGDGYPQMGYPPGNQTPQYGMQNQVYKLPQFGNRDMELPQFGNRDGEMHTVPADTKFVVYDFDYQKPVERKYSTGKPSQFRESPAREIDRQRPREITPLRETVRVRPPVHLDSATTDHTSDNDSSVSGTTEDETTTDDQIVARSGYNIVPYGYFNQPAGAHPADSGTRLYDPRNFQRIDNRNIGGMSDNRTKGGVSDHRIVGGVSDNRTLGSVGDHRTVGGMSDISRPVGPSISSRTAEEPIVRDTQSVDVQDGPDVPLVESRLDAGSTQEASEVLPESPSPSRDGPVPQVPPIPKNFQRSQPSPSPTRDMPWPHGPPPPYSPGERFQV